MFSPVSWKCKISEQFVRQMNRLTSKHICGKICPNNASYIHECIVQRPGQNADFILS